MGSDDSARSDTLRTQSSPVVLLRSDERSIDSQESGSTENDDHIVLDNCLSIKMNDTHQDGQDCDDIRSKLALDIPKRSVKGHKLKSLKSWRLLFTSSSSSRPIFNSTATCTLLESGSQGGPLKKNQNADGSPRITFGGNEFFVARPTLEGVPPLSSFSASAPLHVLHEVTDKQHNKCTGSKKQLPKRSRTNESTKKKSLRSRWNRRKDGSFYYVCQLITQVAGFGNAAKWSTMSIENGFLPFLCVYCIVVFTLIYPVLYFYIILSHIVGGLLPEALTKVNSQYAKMLILFSVISPITCLMFYHVLVGRSFLYMFQSLSQQTISDGESCSQVVDKIECLQYHTSSDILNATSFPCDWYIGNLDADINEVGSCRSKVFTNAIEYWGSTEGAFVVGDPDSFGDISGTMFTVLLAVAILAGIIGGSNLRITLAVTHMVPLFLCILTTLLSLMMFTWRASPYLSLVSLKNVFFAKCHWSTFFTMKLWNDALVCGLFSLGIGSGTIVLTSHLSPMTLNSRVLVFGTILGDTAISVMYGVIFNIFLVYGYSVFGVAEGTEYFGLDGDALDGIQLPPMHSRSNELIRCFPEENNCTKFIYPPIPDSFNLDMTLQTSQTTVPTGAFDSYQYMYIVVPSLISHLYGSQLLLRSLTELMFYAPISYLAFVTYASYLQVVNIILRNSRFIADYMPWTTKNQFALAMVLVQIPHLVVLSSNIGDCTQRILNAWSDIWLTVMFVFVLIAHVSRSGYISSRPIYH
eukprot:GHVH01015899.1.p1 GENE.GHVH01015899.1~~GHVH01015899.1.p1  ORF type:complete len:751 (-),score=78.97 GHVH01015899.1:2324-4576(-)